MLTRLPIMLLAYPEIFLLAAGCAILVIDLFLKDSTRWVTYALSLAALLGCAVLTMIVTGMTGGQLAYTFNGMFVSDMMASVLKMFTYVAVALCLVYSRVYMADRGLYRGEYFVLALFATLGMMVMISASHFLTLYLGLELMSLCLYSLVALNRESAVSSEAAMKYFVLGAIASGLLLYGMSMIYGATGTLAYSTISHMGFMLLGLLSGIVGGNALSAAEAWSSAMFYAVVYVLMSLGAFGMVVLLSRAGFEAERIEDFRGLNGRRPWFAFIMLLLMFSLAGIPPTVGFYAKLSVLQSVLGTGQVWLALVAVMFALVGTFYYIRVVRLMYFDEPQDAGRIDAKLDVSVLLSANGLAVLVLGILPQPLMQLCFYAIKGL